MDSVRHAYRLNRSTQSSSCEANARPSHAAALKSMPQSPFLSSDQNATTSAVGRFTCVVNPLDIQSQTPANGLAQNRGTLE